MIQANVILDGDGCWPDATPDNKKVEWVDNPRIEFARLTEGMISGKSSVSIRVNRQDGTAVIAQISMTLLLSVADAFRSVEGA